MLKLTVDVFEIRLDQPTTFSLLELAKTWLEIIDVDGVEQLSQHIPATTNASADIKDLAASDALFERLQELLCEHDISNMEVIVIRHRF
jgi:hypothetical protein